MSGTSCPPPAGESASGRGATLLSGGTPLGGRMSCGFASILLGLESPVTAVSASLSARFLFLVASLMLTFKEPQEARQRTKAGMKSLRAKRMAMLSHHLGTMIKEALRAISPTAAAADSG